MANQYTGLDTREFNGWPNRSTWNIHLWLGSLETYYDEYSDLVNRAAKSGNGDAAWEWVKRLYRRVWRENAKADACVWSHVDWQRLREHFNTDVEDAKRYGS